jgi:molecular chaperone GrpE (heat shock protein)
MDNPKQRLEAKLIEFQQQIIRTAQASKEQAKAQQDQEDALFLELLEVLDGFENIFRNLEGKREELDKTTKRALKSFEALQRKLLRLLSGRGVAPIELPTGKAIVGLCKVVETRAAPDTTTAPGSILVQVRQGYQREGRVLRPVEVITAEGEMTHVVNDAITDAAM